MIDFTRAFDSAWERMMIILFRPFDLGKWFVIGFSAFLAGLLQGGNGFNGGSFNNIGNLNNKSGTNNQLPTFNAHQFNSQLSHLMSGTQIGFIIAVAAVVIFIIFAIALVIYWLGSRGQFLFLDNIVRNRGAIVWPWQNYSRQANSLFGIYLIFLAITFAIFLPIIVVGVVMTIPLLQQSRWPIGGEIIGFVVLLLVYLVLVLVLGVILFLFREFGVPIMFRNGLMARPAFMEAMNVVRQNPGSVAIFVLLRMALSVAVGFLSLATCCLCCTGLIPYIGTVVILPALIYVRCFTLDCLAQFGPQYDVWTVDVQQPGSVNLPPPRG